MAFVNCDPPLAREQLRQVYSEHVDAVHGFLLARCGSPELAEDLTTDTFLNAADRFAQGRGAEVTIGWLITTARRRLIDHWRKSTTQRSRLERFRSETIRSNAVKAATGSDGRTLTALLSLTETQRAALTLRYIDEHSVSEVADLLGLSYQAAESLLARARRSFKQSYEVASS